MWKTTLVILGALAFAAPSRSQAQHWSADEQEVLDALESCWDIWMGGIRAGTGPEAWITQCASPDLTYWGSTEGAPGGVQMVRRNWDVVSQVDRNWLDIRPVAVKRLGDVAIVHFYGLWSAASPEGPKVTEWKRTEVFHKVNGNWLLVAAHSSPSSPADAVPYR